MGKDLLSDASDASDDERDISGKGSTLKVNRSFASKFERQKRAQELSRAKELLEEEGEDSETSESEDEDAELLDPSLDLQIINTINMIKKKDPKIYDKGAKWFDDEEDDSNDDEEEEEEVTKSSKKKTFKEVAKEQLLQGGDDSDVEMDTRRDKSALKTSQLIYDREQESMRKAFIKAAAAEEDESEEESDDDGMLKVKVRSAKEQEAEDAKVQQALREMKALAMQQEGEKAEQINFLTNYMSQKMWKQPAHLQTAAFDDEEDEEELDKVDMFESKYNFRFEELADQQRLREEAREEGAGDLRARVSFDLGEKQGAQVLGHARNVADSLRRVDDKRKQEREARKERKEKEKRQKEAEIRRLKNVKRQELQERLHKIGELGGLRDLQLDESLLDEDWDPAKHEEMMSRQFGDDYYNAQDDDLRLDEEAGDPLAPELGGYEEGYDDGYDHGYGEEFEGGEGYGGEGGGEEVDEEAERAAIHSLQDDLYKLDYEDLVAGLPCRFKYRQVEPEDFGLSAEDILLADDKELNRYVSLKKLAPYDTRKRWNEEELRKKRRRLRQTVKERRQALREEEERREELRLRSLEGQQRREEQRLSMVEAAEAGKGEDKKKRRRRKRQHDGEEDQGEVVRERGEERAQELEEEKTPTVRTQSSTGGSNGEVNAKKKNKKDKKNKKQKEESDPVKRRLAMYQ